MNLDHHLSDNLTERDYRAKRDRERKVEERAKEIMASVDEITYLLSENPSNLASFIRPLLGENYLDFMPEFRAYMRGLAVEMADDEVQPWEDFR